MSFYLGPRSLWRLRGIHPDLVAVVKYAIKMPTAIDFTVVCGLRTLERQKELYAAGASMTMDSRHLTGHAVDLAPIVAGKLSWSTPAFWPLMHRVMLAAHLLDVPIRWGGDWNGNGILDERFFDAPHFELPKGLYHRSDMLHHSPKAEAFLAGKL